MGQSRGMVGVGIPQHSSSELVGLAPSARRLTSVCSLRRLRPFESAARRSVPRVIKLVRCCCSGDLSACPVVASATRHAPGSLAAARAALLAAAARCTLVPRILLQEGVRRRRTPSA